MYEGPGVAASRAEEREKDIFTKSEKWLPAMPLPDFSKWSKSRQEEILCFSEYMSQFRSWIALASDTFAFEIESAIRHPEELHMGGLKPAQQLRSSRLLELVFGEDLILFSTFFPRGVNLSILWSFLEPILPRTHFGVDVRGWYNGGEIGSRPIQCENGFFMQIRFLSTPFLLSELYRSAPMHVACLHPVTDYPRTYDVQWSVVYIAGGHTLISSRVYERVDVHGQAALIRGLHQRYPDLVDDNSYLVKVHWSICSLEPVVNHAKERYVLAVLEEDLVEPTVVSKVDLPPYVDIGAIRVPQTLTKRRLILQTGLDLVCGPGGEICACYHNGYELLSGEMVTADDGDFFACWLDGEPQRSPLVTAGGFLVSPTAGREIAIESTFCPSPAAGGDNRH